MRCSFVAAVYGLLAITSSVTAILDVGYSHACATVGASLKCWGENERGQLGRGDTNTTGDEPDEMGDNLIAVDLGTGEVASEVALGKEHTCALLSSGDVKCFGYNSEGQLGQGDTVSRGESAGQMGDALPAIDLGTGVSATALAVGCSHTCVLLDDNTVKCFGYNNYGQLGQGTTDNIGDDAGEMGDSLPAISLGDVTVTSIAAGCDFTCALIDGGIVMCWGRNTYGQLGAGDSEDRLDEEGEELVAVDLGESSAVAIAAGEGHVCAFLDDSTMKCWGHNDVGQLGLGDTDDRGDTPESLGTNLTAVELASADVISEIDLGAFHTCVLLEDYSIKCFGENGHGELGIGSDDNVGELPTDMGENVTAVDLGGTATDIAVGGSSACAVLSDNSIKCWGQGNSGQLGQGDDEDIGDEPGVLADTPSVDLGSGTSSASPTPSPMVTSAAPSASPTVSQTHSLTVSPTVSSKASPTFSPTAVPIARSRQDDTSSGSTVVSGRGLLASVVLGVVGFMGFSFI